MVSKDIFLDVTKVIGGLSLFIFGMNVMTRSMREAAGAKLQGILSSATKSRFRGLGLGALSGFVVHSSASTVMLVGFVNAGLLSLVEALPVVFGANIGTTLSMQVISFKLDHYCFLAIGTGFLLCTKFHDSGKKS